MVEKIGGYRERGKPFLAWLYAIARNLLTDHYRKAPEVDLPLDEEWVAGSGNPLPTLTGGLTQLCFSARCTPSRSRSAKWSLEDSRGAPQRRDGSDHGQTGGIDQVSAAPALAPCVERLRRKYR